MRASEQPLSNMILIYEQTKIKKFMQKLQIFENVMPKKFHVILGLCVESKTENYY